VDVEQMQAAAAGGGEIVFKVRRHDQQDARTQFQTPAVEIRLAYAGGDEEEGVTCAQFLK
jgi:hypothetical protein